MKKVLSIVLCLCIVLSVIAVVPFSTSAAESEIAEVGATSGTTGDCTWTLDGTVLTISGNGAMADYKSNSTLPWGNDITTVIIADGVTKIGKYAFYECKALTSVTIGDSVTSIGSLAFYNCYNLTNISFPDSVTSIGDHAFSYCSGLTSVTIPESVTSIGNEVFYNTAWYDNQPDGLVYAGKVAYKMKGSCPAEVALKEDTLGIAGFAFCDCKSLTNVTIPYSVTSIGDYAFASCTSLSNITIPDSIKNIGYMLFYSCSSLTSILIPDSVTNIGGSAFSGCTGLTSVTIPDSVTSIGNSAFDGCYRLTSINIPGSVTSIGDFAFYGCTGLTRVHISDIAAWCSISFADSNSNPLSYANNLYLNNELVTDLVIPDSVTIISSYAFYGCTDLTNVMIPNSVTNIGEMAFGYYYDSNTFRDKTIDNFSIYGYDGSAADDYALANHFDFVDLNTHPVPHTDPPAKVILGDVDGDGDVEISDVTWILRHIAKVEMPFLIDKETSDIDGDGEITVMDATAIQYYLANMKNRYNIGTVVG